MLSLGVIVLTAASVLGSLLAIEKKSMPMPTIVGRRMERLWQLAQSSLKQRKYLRAEKALLTILKLDKKNAPAYNHLGILYSHQREYRDAIECFEIASSIKPSSSTLHNLGLVYYETENFEKAAVAFEEALAMDDSLAQRHIAYAKVLEKLDKGDRAIEHMMTAVRLERSLQSLKLLGQMYETYGYKAKARHINKQIEKLTDEKGALRRVRRPNRLIY